MVAGVLGYGTAGRLHARGYQHVAAVKRVVVFDPAPSTSVERGMEQMPTLDAFWAARPDVVSVCTPTATHVAYVADALKRGCHVLCEKPLAQRAADILPWLRYAARHGLVVGAAFAHRFFGPTVRLAGLVRSGRLGQPTFFYNRFAVNMRAGAAWKSDPKISGGGAAIDTLIHSIDLYRFFFGEPRDMVVHTAQALPDRFAPVEDTVVALVQGDGPLRAVLQADWTTPVKEYALAVYGTAGQGAVSFDPPALTWYDEAGERYVEPFPGTALDRFDAMIAHFVAACAGRENLRNAGDDGACALDWLERGLKASRSRFGEGSQPTD